MKAQLLPFKSLNEGVRFGDQMIISPVMGRKKTVTLRRKSIELKSVAASEISSADRTPSLFGNLLLPTWDNDHFHYSLDLKGQGKVDIDQEDQVDQKNQEEKGRYLLQSHNSIPFSINGTLSFSSYLQRGDKVDIGPYQLYFTHSSHQISQQRSKYHHDLTTDTQSSINHHLDIHHDLLRESPLLCTSLIQSSLNILIEGETGTGKTRLAKAIHERSGRLGQFIHINLSSFVSTLIESELFGHVKGSFTGALTDKKGAFLEAHHGTLFLDEIDSLPKEVQTKLLLFLDSHEVRPVGGQKNIHCDVRLIFASGKSLQKLVYQQEMRHDFYFRLSSGVKIHLPALREGPDKISRICHEWSLQEDRNISLPLQEFYKTLPWPGNIRQLISHLQKKKVFSKNYKLDFDKLDEELISTSSENNKFFIWGAEFEFEVKAEVKAEAEAENGNGNEKNLESKKPLLNYHSLKDWQYHYTLKVYLHLQGNEYKCCKILKISRHKLRKILHLPLSSKKKNDDSDDQLVTIEKI